MAAQVDQPAEIDGWFISFHEPLQTGQPPAKPLGLYFCPADAVLEILTAITPCDGHPVRKYLVALEDCCLEHSNADSRSGAFPAQPGSFNEEETFQYDIDIQAVFGHTLPTDPGTGLCLAAVPTGNEADADAWGWHTTAIENGIRQALTSTVAMQGNDWLYGPWNLVAPTCGSDNMAFELLTPAPAECGNNLTEAGEECDDGNTASGDGCDANCVIEFCGDGIVNNAGTEQCDDGNTVSGDGCDANCVTEFCGDGTVNNSGTEQCDDGNTLSGDGCDANCVIEFCGDGIVNDAPNEECDDGGANSDTTPDACRTNCKNASCGDNVVDTGEQCDDGNTANGDGCDDNCQNEGPESPNVTGGIGSRYIQLEPKVLSSAAQRGPDPMGFRIECGAVTEWVRMEGTDGEIDYDDGGGVLVNIGVGVADCASASFLTPRQWTSGGANALYVTGLSVPPGSKPTVYALGDCTGSTDSDPVQPAYATWVYCDSSGDASVNFFADLFKQFSNTTASCGCAGYAGPDPGIEVDTQGDSPTVPDGTINFFADIFQCFSATSVGGGDMWTGETCP